MQLIEKWIDKINSNQRLVENGRWLNITFTFGIENKDYLIEIINGKVSSITKRTILTKSGTFKIHRGFSLKSKSTQQKCNHEKFSPEKITTLHFAFSACGPFT